MSDLPLVSIITPSFNQADYLEETIKSVLNQSYENIEYLIIDGNSTDKSCDIIKKYENELTYWISEPDSGQADAINKGLKLAKGDYQCWVNSDDILYPEFVSMRVQQFQEDPSRSFIYGDVEQGASIVHKRPRKGAPTDFYKMLKSLQVPIPQQSSMWKKEVIEKIGLLETKWNVLLDRELFMRVARFFPITYIEGSVAFFRNHESSKSISLEIKWAEEIPKLYYEIFELNIYTLPQKILMQKNKYLFSAYFYAYQISKNLNEKELVYEFKRKAIKTSPFNFQINTLKLGILGRFRKIKMKLNSVWA